MWNLFGWLCKTCRFLARLSQKENLTEKEYFLRYFLFALFIFISCKNEWKNAFIISFIYKCTTPCLLRLSLAAVWAVALFFFTYSQCVFNAVVCWKKKYLKFEFYAEKTKTVSHRNSHTMHWNGKQEQKWLQQFYTCATQEYRLYCRVCLFCEIDRCNKAIFTLLFQLQASFEYMKCMPAEPPACLRLCAVAYLAVAFGIVQPLVSRLFLSRLFLSLLQPYFLIFNFFSFIN